MKYKPTDIDLTWAKNVTMLLNDEGILAFPGGHHIYRVSHSKATMTLLNPEILADPDAMELHEKTRTVFGMIGYRVIEQEDA